MSKIPKEHIFLFNVVCVYQNNKRIFLIKEESVLQCTFILDIKKIDNSDTTISITIVFFLRIFTVDLVDLEYE